MRKEKTPFPSLNLTVDELRSVVLTETARGHVRYTMRNDFIFGRGVCSGCVAAISAFVKGWKPDARPTVAHGDRPATVEEVRDMYEADEAFRGLP